MTENNSKNQTVYEENIPKEIKELISEGVWQERIEEIAKKYSLNETQTETLTDNVLFVITGIDPIDKFLETLSQELGISKILADQLTDDLEKRVFEYVLKKIEKNTEKTEDKITEKKTTPSPVSIIPEIRPENLPTKQEAPKTPVQPIFGSKPGVSAPVKTTLTQEPIQRPVSVPRFTAIPMEEEHAIPPQPQKTPEPIINPSIIKPAQQVPPSPMKPSISETTKPENKYAVDPYREPIE
jgi:hypothetical protein